MGCVVLLRQEMSEENLFVKPRLYLRVGDIVRHLHHTGWGDGEVIEEKHSDLPGGLCLVRVLFEDGIERSFINDLGNTCCCFYAGLRLSGE
jgi:hypothetical protein